jgi:hypothetical protein
MSGIDLVVVGAGFFGLTVAERAESARSCRRAVELLRLPVLLSQSPLTGCQFGKFRPEIL